VLVLSVSTQEAYIKWKIVYAVLWLLTIVMYSLPWARANGKVFVGWGFTMPFFLTYVIGMILGLIVLVTKYKPVLITIVAGLLMMFGILGAVFGFSVGAMIGQLTGAKTSMEPGLGGPSSSQ